MTWAKLDDGFGDDPTLLGLPRGVRLLYVEGIVWCCKHETDGAILAHVVARITDEPNVGDAVAQLVGAGLWAATETGFEVVDFLANQRSAADIKKMREANAFVQRRRRKHGEGDHSLCTRGRYCAEGALSRDDISPDTRGESSLPDPTRPDPTIKGGEGGRVKGSASAAARVERATRLRRPGSAITLTMPDDFDEGDDS